MSQQIQTLQVQISKKEIYQDFPSYNLQSTPRETIDAFDKVQFRDRPAAALMSIGLEKCASTYPVVSKEKKLD